jgi:hypothetical protein
MNTQLSASADVSPGACENDPLAEIDDLLQKRRNDLQTSATHGAQLTAQRSQFSAQFATVCQQQVRPAMEAIIERLRRNGGGAVIEEHPADFRYQNHRLIMWMSLQGDIAGVPRQDRHPYLQLDADVAKRNVAVSEGDMWDGHGGNRSGKIGEWQLSEITTARVTDEILAILRRAVQ